MADAENDGEANAVQMMGNVIGSCTLSATATTHMPLSSDNPLSSLLGAIVTSWSSFEHVIEGAVWTALARHIDYGSEKTAAMPQLRLKFKGLSKALQQRGLHPAFEEEFSALWAAAEGVQERRNRVMHDPWFVSGLGVLQQRRPNNEKKNFRLEFIDVPEGDLRLLLADIHHLIILAKDLDARIALRS